MMIRPRPKPLRFATAGLAVVALAAITMAQGTKTEAKFEGIVASLQT
ncbi:MAG: hypothetical protein ABI565_12045 [Vicinamibacteria bacterium]